MALLQCEMCCGELDISTDKSVGICRYCGSKFTIPKAIEKKGNLFNRANYLRQNCNFDKAISVYESILADNCEDADALWGLVLCRYGIEFVEDPKSKTRIPTCHRTSRKSILLDPDFKSAIRFADDAKRVVYYENATQIDQIQRAILSLSDSQEKYDVFICYKETDANGERSVDSVLAHELYNELTKLRIKTFFARKTLEGKAGSQYEPIIYSALNSAKVMVVLGTKPENFEATWVKNEWSRYLDFMKDSDDKHLIPVYRDMSAYQLPEEFVAIQALDMARIGFMIDLCDGIKKLLHKEGKNEDIGVGPISKESLYSRAMVFLGNREFYKAVDYFDKVLDIDPQYARAYWGALLASHQCVSAAELIECTSDDWTEDARLSNAIQFAGEEERKLYAGTIEKRFANFKRMANSALEGKDYEKCQAWCSKYIEYDPYDGSIWWIKLLAMNGACDSNALYDRCVQNMNSPVDTEEYLNALKYSIPEESVMFENTMAKIQVAVDERQRQQAYNACMTYMQEAINALRRNRNKHISNQWTHFDAEAQNYNALMHTGGHFYRNNIFVFLVYTLVWGVSAAIGAILIAFMEQSSSEMNVIFGVIFAIAMIVTMTIAFCKYLVGVKRVSRLVKACTNTEAIQDADVENIRFYEECEAQASVLLNRFAANPDQTIEQIAEQRQEFQTVYEGLSVKR